MRSATLFLNLTFSLPWSSMVWAIFSLVSLFNLSTPVRSMPLISMFEPHWSVTYFRLIFSQLIINFLVSLWYLAWWSMTNSSWKFKWLSRATLAVTTWLSSKQESTQSRISPVWSIFMLSLSTITTLSTRGVLPLLVLLMFCGKSTIWDLLVAWKEGSSHHHC